MNIPRKLTWDCYDYNYCPQCAKVVEWERGIGIRLPGIPTIKCKECHGYFTVNFLEDENDIIKCPDHFNFDRLEELKNETKINGVGDLCATICCAEMADIGCCKCPINNMMDKYDIEATITKKCDCNKHVEYSYDSKYEVFLKECKDCGKSWEIDTEELTEEQIKPIFEIGDTIISNMYK